MKKLVITTIVLGSLLLIGGAALVGYGYAKGYANVEKITTPYEISTEINNINIDLNVTDLEFKVSEGDEKKVICEHTEKIVHEVNVDTENKTLSIKQNDKRAWYEKWFDFTVSYLKATVYLPAGNYGDLKIESSTGNIRMDEGFTFNSVDIKISTGNINAKISSVNDFKVDASTGKVELENSTAKNYDIKTSTGLVKLTNVVAIEHMKVHCSTGGIKLSSVDAKTLDLKSSTGDIEGSIKTAKKFEAEASTGSVKVPPSDPSAGLCKIKTSTGDINITIG